MPMTITEKILAAHCEKKEIFPGELINAKIDLALGNDVTAPLAIEEFEKINVRNVFDPDKIALIPDHFTPNKDIKSAQQCIIMRNFARRHNIRHYYEIGRGGVEHVLLPELGVVLSGEVIIGADSHTCTYGALGSFSTGVGSTDLAAAMATGECWFKVPESIKFIYKGKLNKWVGGKDLILYTIGDIGVDGALYKAMEFSGDTISVLPMSDRFTMANMAIEAGGKNGIFEPDDITLKYVENKANRPYERYYSDDKAKYSELKEYDVSKIEPQVAFPFLPSNARPVTAVASIAVDQAFIGSCTNGRIEDLRIAAEILKGKKVHPYVKLIVIPATQNIYLEAIKEGLIEIFVNAGAVVSTPTCGPCLGGHMGVLGPGEIAIATTNRNFVGRMGDLKSEVYLANPAVVAASAITGKITNPEEIRKG